MKKLPPFKFIKIRNEMARKAWDKKGGPHRDKRDKRREKYPKQSLED